MNSIVKHIYIIIAIIFAFALLSSTIAILWRFSEPDLAHTIPKTDTAYVKEIHHYQPINNNAPVKVVIQEKRDTIYRERVEKGDIITGVSIKGNEVDIQKIDTSGKISEEKHKIEEGFKVEFDNNNFQEKKRTRVGRILRKVGKITLNSLGVIGGAFIAVEAAKNLHK